MVKWMRVSIVMVLLSFLVAACGTDDVKKESSNNENSANNTNNTNNINNESDAGDMGESDAGPTCDDGLVNQDETDLDCGGDVCDPCDLTLTCIDDDDCLSGRCDAGSCAEPLKALGEVCTEASECESAQCEAFGDTSYCSTACTDTCDGQNLACFRDLCTPDTYCDDPDNDGIGLGPGCAGSPCDLCDTNATCNEVQDETFECVCNNGWDGDGSTCTDIDECSLDSDNCDGNATCTNTPGSFDCACDAGYMGDGTVCMDVDECTDGTNDCDVNATCTNEVGGFACACSFGWSGDGRTCADIDECGDGTDNCNANATCTNTPGSFSCACDAGYSGNGVICSDVNECTTGQSNCSSDATCTNTVGSFTCACNSGFTGDGVTCTDVNECATNPCDSNASCTNTPGDFDCTCNSGYAGTGLVCSDVDECLANSDNCSPTNAICTNTPGSWTCACEPGFTGDGTTCTDINECTVTPGICGASATCTNIPGSYSCTCDAGYEFNSSTGLCVDTNECADGSNMCDANALCFNFPGSYSCTCGTGYQGDGFTCSDLDECANPSLNACDANAACTNVTGTYLCDCNSGYTGNGFTCVDDDECALGTDTCDDNATCTNTAGSFSCACDAGYVGDGFSCCPNPTTVTSLPFNASGDTTSSSNDFGFSANSCPGVSSARGGGSNDDVYSFTPTSTGWYRIHTTTQFDAVLYIFTDCGDVDNSCVEAADSGFGSSNSVEDIDVELQAGVTYLIVVDGFPSGSNLSGPYTLYIDFNECLNGTDSCSAPTTCSKTIPGYSCDCAEGYNYDGMNCVDIDECAVGTDNCDVNATCANTPGSFTCTCNPPLSGDGTSCHDATALGESCINPFIVNTMPFVAAGDTTGAFNDYSTQTGDCTGISSGRGDGSADEVFSFTPAIDGEYEFTVDTLDAAIYLVTDCSDIGTTCVDGSWNSGAAVAEVITTTLTAGTTYYLIVDGWTNFSNTEGAYNLNVVCNDCP